MSYNSLFFHLMDFWIIWYLIDQIRFRYITILITQNINIQYLNVYENKICNELEKIIRTRVCLKASFVICVIPYSKRSRCFLTFHIELPPKKKLTKCFLSFTWCETRVVAWNHVLEVMHIIYVHDYIHRFIHIQRRCHIINDVFSMSKSLVS